MPASVDLDIVIGVDDTGGEGEAVESRSIDKHRRTLVAAIVGKGNFDAFTTDWKSLVGSLQREFGVTEFHSSKLWGGTVLNAQPNKKAKQEAEQKILLSFGNAAELCIKHGIAFTIQTVHGETFETLVNELQSPSSPVFFKQLAKELTTPSENRKLAAFVLLSRQVLRWSRKAAVSHKALEKQLTVNAEWKIDNAPDFSSLPQQAQEFSASGFATSTFQFLQSHQCALIQAADFCAYVVNRHMYFLANRTKSAAGNKPSPGFIRATSLLQNTRDILPYILNLPRYNIQVHDIHADTYDALHDKDRASKGLNPLDFK